MRADRAKKNAREGRFGKRRVIAEAIRGRRVNDTGGGIIGVALRKKKGGTSKNRAKRSSDARGDLRNNDKHYDRAAGGASGRRATVANKYPPIIEIESSSRFE